MAESGAGMQVAEFFIKSFGIKNLPWAMLIAGFIIGIPVFLSRYFNITTVSNFNS